MYPHFGLSPFSHIPDTLKGGKLPCCPLDVAVGGDRRHGCTQGTTCVPAKPCATDLGCAHPPCAGVFSGIFSIGAEFFPGRKGHHILLLLAKLPPQTPPKGPGLLGAAGAEGVVTVTTGLKKGSRFPALSIAPFGLGNYFQPPFWPILAINLPGFTWCCGL